MKYLMKLFWLFIPRVDPPAPVAPPPPAPAPPIGGSPPDGRPDWLPEKFWNQDLKAPRTEMLGKGYTELEGKLRTNSEKLKAEIRAEQLALAPAAYEVNLSKDLQIPEDVDLNLTKEDPLVNWFFGFAKENGMSQELVDKALNAYIKIELDNLPNVPKEIEKLGDYGQDRLLKVHNWLESKLSAPQFKSLNGLLTSADQIEALEVLMKQSGPSDFQGDSGGAPLSLDELRSMQNDKRYWQSKDPAFIKKVTDGYERLYKGK